MMPKSKGNSRKTAFWLCVAAIGVVCTPAMGAGRLTTTSAEALNGQLADGYRIAAGDKLRITVFDEPNLSGEFSIGVGGDLAMPLLEAMPADGKTTDDLRQMIATGLEKGGYVVSPRVSVEIVEHRPFYILGEVNKPGEYPYAGDLTLDQAVAKAGGFTARANKHLIFLQRQSEEKVRVQLGETPLRIAPGDTIVVREAFF